MNDSLFHYYMENDRSGFVIYTGPLCEQKGY